MTVSDLLSTEFGITTAFTLTWAVAIWGYKKNKEDHDGLGDKVDAAKDEIFESMEKLGDKIDGVREAITQHESIWHAPETVSNATQTKAKSRKGATKKNKIK
jgi:hypothetical protein